MSDLVPVVVGPPRSGTSVVASVLQERLGYTIDEGPTTQYEDEQLVAINERLLGRWRLRRNQAERIDRRWAVEFATWVTMREATYQRWGFKDPRMVGFIHWVLPFLDDPVFVYPIRRDDQIIKSQVEKLGYSRELAERGVVACRECIERRLPAERLHRIDLTERKSISAIRGELEQILRRADVLREAC